MKEINLNLERSDKVKITLSTGEYVIFKLLSLKELNKIKPLIKKLESEDDELISAIEDLFKIMVLEHNLGKIEDIPVLYLKEILEIIVAEQSLKKN